MRDRRPVLFHSDIGAVSAIAAKHCLGIKEVGCTSVPFYFYSRTPRLAVDRGKRGGQGEGGRGQQF